MLYVVIQENKNKKVAWAIRVNDLASSTSRLGHCQSNFSFLKDDHYCSSNNAKSYEMQLLPVT